ncbi:MAG: redoxin domain-containing protein [bacterium]
MKKNKKKLLVILCAATLFSLIGYGHAKAQPENQIINSIPTLKDTGGSSFSVSELNDHFTLFVFFSIYSDNSAATLKYLSAMRKQPQFANKLRIIGVNVDPSTNSLDNFLRKNKVQFRILLDVSLEFSNRFSVRNPPSLFLIDPSRAVIFANSGVEPYSLQDIETRLSGLVSAGNGKSRAAADKPDSMDKMFLDKKLISANTRFLKFCRGNDALLLYVSDDGSLFQLNSRDMARRLLATDVASADWAPDCKSVVFAQKEKSGVWIKPLDGAAVEIADEGRSPQWSPRDNFIVFMVREEVWTHQIATKKRWQISADIKSIQWSPDGSLLQLTDVKGRSWLVSPFAHASLIEKLFK